MELTQFFKGVLNEDKSAVVICDMNHKIIYMNPAACERYSKKGGASLLGSNLLDCHNSKSNEMIHKVIEWFKSSKLHNRIYISYNEKGEYELYIDNELTTVLDNTTANKLIDAGITYNKTQMR